MGGGGSGWARHRSVAGCWSGRFLGVFVPVVVEEYGPGFDRVIEFFGGHGNGFDSYDPDRGMGWGLGAYRAGGVVRTTRSLSGRGVPGRGLSG